jgi:hypothetical protein
MVVESFIKKLYHPPKRVYNKNSTGYANALPHTHQGNPTDSSPARPSSRSDNNNPENSTENNPFIVIIIKRSKEKTTDVIKQSEILYIYIYNIGSNRIISALNYITYSYQLSNFNSNILFLFLVLFALKSTKKKKKKK